MSAEQIEGTGLLAAMDDIAKFVEFQTGIKNQFIAAGWDERTAELMTYEVYRKTGWQR